MIGGCRPMWLARRVASASRLVEQADDAGQLGAEAIGGVEQDAALAKAVAQGGQQLLELDVVGIELVDDAVMV